MDQEAATLWGWTATHGRNIRTETMAVIECQRGTMEPLSMILAESGVSLDLAALICLTIKNRPKPPKVTKTYRIGYEVEKRMWQRPGEKKTILAEVAALPQFMRGEKNLSDKTVSNYHDGLIRSLKKHEMTRDELAELRTRFQDPTST
jgi:hypothetical protein